MRSGRAGRAGGGCPDRSGQARLYAEFAEDMFQVFLYGAQADAQACSNLSVRLSAGDPEKDVRLAAREAELLECGDGGGLIRT